MATVELEIGARKYLVSCRDGEEDSLFSAAALVDKRARDAAAALGSLSEGRLLLFTALMLADDVQELKRQPGAAATPPPPADDRLAVALEAMAARLEAVAERAETGSGAPRRA